MKMFKYAVTVCVCTWGAAGAADYDGPGVAGTIAEDTTWAGDVYLAGDLLITPGATLTVEAGTRVTVAREDALSRGILIHGDSRRVEVEVEGTLALNGTPEARVVFVPEADGSPDETWSGFELKKGGSLAAGDAWFVGARWPLPSAAVLSDDVYTVEETRKSGSAYLLYWGRDGTGKGTYFYPDGTLIPKEVIKANRGYSRWIIAPCLTAAGSVAAFFIGMSIAFQEHGPSPSAAEAYWPLLIPPLCFGIGYLAGFGIDTRWGARRAQDKWLKEHPDFMPPF